MQWINTLDTYIFRWINSNGIEILDPIMILVSSKFFWIPLYLYLIFLLYKKFSRKFIWVLASVVVLIFFADYGSVHLFKEVFERLRPCHQLDDVRTINGCGGLYGFISSHAANAFSVPFFINILLKNRKLFYFLLLWSILIGFSRVYLGVHFPFDILGGACWGMLVSLLTYRILKLKINEAI